MGKPEQTFRSGTICASVWDNEVERDGEVRAFKSISFDRRYKDKDGEWQSTNSLRVSDIPRAIMVLGKAFEHLSLR